MKPHPKRQVSYTEEGNLVIYVPIALKQNRGRKTIITPDTPDGTPAESEDNVQVAITQALARAFSWAELIESGKFSSITALAKRLDVDPSYISRILKLVNLAPDIVESIISGREPDGLSLSKLIKEFPADWEEQRKHFQCP